MSDGHGPTARSRRAFLKSAVAATAIAGSAGAAAAQETHTVDLTDDLTFEPAAVTASAGDTVVWENVGQVGHSVTAYEADIPDEADYFASGGFGSESAARDAFPEGELGGGDSFEYTFEVPGTYEYFCIPHEGAGMVGTVAVESGEEPGPTPGSGEPLLPENPFSPLVLVLAVLAAAAVTGYEVFVRGLD